MHDGSTCVSHDTVHVGVPQLLPLQLGTLDEESLLLEELEVVESDELVFDVDDVLVVLLEDDELVLFDDVVVVLGALVDT